MPNNLEIMVQELPSLKAKALLEQFQGFFKMAEEWEAKARMIAVTHESQKAEMKLARTGRLFLREKRIEIEKTRKQLKEDSLREGKAIDGIANVLKALIEPIEKYLDEQEHFVELREAEAERLRQLELQKIAEAERIAREKAETEERMREKLELERMRIELMETNRKQQEKDEEIARMQKKEMELILQARRAKEELERLEAEGKRCVTFVPPVDGTVNNESTYHICPACGHTWEAK